MPRMSAQESTRSRVTRSVQRAIKMSSQLDESQLFLDDDKQVMHVEGGRYQNNEIGINVAKDALSHVGVLVDEGFARKIQKTTLSSRAIHGRWKVFACMVSVHEAANISQALLLLHLLITLSACYDEKSSSN